MTMGAASNINNTATFINALMQPKKLNVRDGLLNVSDELFHNDLHHHPFAAPLRRRRDGGAALSPD